MEDGIERGNQFVRNLAIPDQVPYRQALRSDESLRLPAKTKQWQTSKEVLIPSDNTVASFWITNPDNVYRDNVAASDFERILDVPGRASDRPVRWHGGEQDHLAASKTRLHEFTGNVGHSNYDSFMFDRNVTGPEGRFGVTGGMPKDNPADNASKTLESEFENLTAYKNRNGSVWARGEMHAQEPEGGRQRHGLYASGSAGRDAFTSSRWSTRCSWVKQMSAIRGLTRRRHTAAPSRSLPSRIPDSRLRILRLPT